MEVFDRLNRFASLPDLSSLFVSNVSQQEFLELASDFNKALALLLDSSLTAVDLTASNVSTFVQTSLPLITELILRRKTPREQETVVAKLICQAARYCALPLSHDVIELCELRNMILMGSIPHSYVFINPKQLSHTHAATHSAYIGHSITSGFYDEYGKPNYALIGGKMLGFWPDEWQALLGESKATGHYVQYYTVEQQWVEGIIVSYDRNANAYRLQVKKVWDAQTEQLVEVNEDINILADLLHRPHYWVDMSNQQNIMGKRTKLKFFSTDVGKFIRVWWSRYQRFYYGRVVAFDTHAKLHTIVYEDNDSRSYDINTKEYELIDAPLDVLKSTTGMSDGQAAKVIADWHRSELSVSVKETQSAELSNQTSQVDEQKATVIVARPSASSVVSLSHHQVDALAAYVDSRGVENMIQCCRDPALPAPSCRILLLYLQLLYKLRQYIGSKNFRDCTWDMKEVLPLALLRYEDEQIRDFSLKDFNDVLYSLRDILNIAASDLKESRKLDVQESFDLLRLSIAGKLLSSSKLQKRFLGLTIVKDIIEVLMPKINPFLQRRHQLLNARAGNVQVIPVRSTAPVAYSALYNKLYISAAKFDKWLEHSNVIEALFGENIHQDMIAKADSLLVYMSVRKHLTESHIVSIWQASRGVHEAIVRVTYNLLLVITPALDAHLKKFLFNLISSTPTREYTEHILRLIKSFTIESLRNNRDDRKDDILSLDSGMGEDKMSNATQASTNRKGQVINAPEKQWMGFGLLWEYVLESAEEKSTIDPSLSSLAVELLVMLLAEEFAEERDMVMQRCIDNIQLGVSVPISLTLLRSILSLYPAANKSWFILSRASVNKTVTISHQIEKLVKQNKLMDVVFAELERYHNQTSNQTSAVADIQSRVKSVKGKPIESSRLRGVVERLDFLQFILSKSFIKLTEAQAMIIWQVFGEDVSSEEALDKLCIWLDGLITNEHPRLLVILATIVQENDVLYPDLSSRFGFLGDIEGKVFELKKQDADNGSMNVLEDNVISKVFHECLMKYISGKQSVRVVSRPAFVSLVVKMFFLVNINSKVIRVDQESSFYWQRSGHLEGLPLLWKIAMDSEDSDISLCMMKILVELHHRSATKNKAQDQAVRASFLRLCFKQQYFAVQMVSGNDTVDTTQEQTLQKQKGQGSAELSKPEEWFEDLHTTTASGDVQHQRISRLIRIIQMFVHRFYYIPNYFVHVRVVTGTDETAGTKFTFKSNDTIGIVRHRLAQYFKEEANIIIIHTTANGNSADRLERDDALISQAKLGLIDTLYVKKKEADQNPSATVGTVPSTETIANTELDKDFSDFMHPLDWIGIGGEKCQVFFSLPKLPFQSAMLSKLDNQALSSVAKQQQIGMLGDVRLANDRYDLVTEFLVPLIKNNSHYIDQLLETLDAHLSSHEVLDRTELAVCAWDAIQTLPFKPSLYLDIQNMIQEGDSARLRQAFDLNCPYRLLYSLQMLDAMLNTNPQYAGIQLLSVSHQVSNECTVRLFTMGGVEYLVSILNNLFDAVSKSSSNEVNTDSHTQSLHLQLIAMVLRVMHYCLMLDPLYRVWRIDCNKMTAKQQESLESSSLKDEQVVPGIVLAHMDASKLVSTLLSCCEMFPSMVLENNGLASSFKSFAEQALDMIFALCTAKEDGLNLLLRSHVMEKLVVTSVQCLLPAEITQSIARRYFEACAAVYLRCADPLLVQEAKPIRMLLFDYLVSTIVTAALSIEQAIANSSQKDQFALQLQSFYSLLAAVEYMRIAPDVLFLDLSPFAMRQSAAAQSAIVFQEVIDSTSSDNSYFQGGSGNCPERKELIRRFVEKLCHQKAVESFHSNVVDGVLIGILRILLVYAHEEKEYMGSLKFTDHMEECDNLIEFFLVKCLLPKADQYGNSSSNSTAALCQTVESRILVYSLLYTLCEKNEENFALLTIAMIKNHPLPSEIVADHLCVAEANADEAHSGLSKYRSYYKKRAWQWDYDPNTILRSSGDYIGLSNQGGTCYMNAFIQQLYHAKSFTDCLLGVAQYSDEAEYSNVLFQMQVMFGYLKYSQKRFYDTLPFCKSLIDYDGQPISLSEQKDINEFAGMLFDKLEKNTAVAELLSQAIQGTYIWQTKSLETSYYSEREEKFYMITVEVKNKKSLLDALDLTVAEELFTGENKIEDSENNKKVDAVRRCAIRDLPPILIIHLKRFEFDLETMNRKKVNDYMSFPTDLDMFPYTEEALSPSEPPKSSVSPLANTINDQKEQESSPQNRETAENKQQRTERGANYYQYNLQGIVAHVGAIDRGHYYSFIKDRQKPAHNGQEDVWYEFNDRLVLPFNPDQIPKECFGGMEEYTNANGQTVSRVRENSAYLLIYERKEATIKPTSGLAGMGSRISPVPSSTALSSLGQEVVHSKQSEEESVVASKSTGCSANKVSKKVEEAIWTENTEFQQDRFLFHKHHCLFYWKMLLLCESLVGKYHSERNEKKENLNIIRYWVLVTLHYLIDVLGRSKAYSSCGVFYDKIEGILQLDPLVAHCIVQEFAGKYTTNYVHVWNRIMYIDCPHQVLLKRYSRIMKMSCKLNRNFYATSGLLPIRPKTSTETSASDSLLKQVQETLTVYQQQGEGNSFYFVVHFLHNLLLTIESVQVEDVARKDGFKYCCVVLQSIVQLGFPELYLVIRLAAIQRIVCVVLSLSPLASHQVPETQLTSCIELISLLVQRTEIPSTSIISDESTLLSMQRIVLLPEDLQAFLNRVFLEESIPASTAEMSPALQHIVAGLGQKDSQRIVDFLYEKLSECTSSSAGAHVSYRPFFRVLSDLLLAVDPTSYQSLITKLASKAAYLAQRLLGSDAEVVYSFSKLLHRLATGSAEGLGVVLRAREQWKDIGGRLMGIRSGGGNRRSIALSSSGSHHQKGGTGTGGGGSFLA